MAFLLKPRNTPRAYLYDASITLTIAAILTFFLIHTAVERVQFIQAAGQAKGIVHTVIDAKHHYDIRFTTADGRDILYRESNWASYEDGQQVTVLYDPHKPDVDHCTNTFLALWDSTMTLSWMSFVFAFISAGLIYFPKYFYGPFSSAYERKQKQAKNRRQSGSV